MRKIIAVCVAVATLIVLAPGQEDPKSRIGASKDHDAASTWRGYLVDVTTGESLSKQGEKSVSLAADYKRSWAQDAERQRSGFGLLTLDGKWFVFDSAGNEKAKALAPTLKAERGLLVTVDGKLEDGTLAVSSIQEREQSMKPGNF